MHDGLRSFTVKERSACVLARNEGIIVRAALVEDVHGLGGKRAIEARDALERARAPSHGPCVDLVDMDVDIHEQGACSQLNSSAPAADRNTACVRFEGRLGVHANPFSERATCNPEVRVAEQEGCNLAAEFVRIQARVADSKCQGMEEAAAITRLLNDSGRRDHVDVVAGGGLRGIVRGRRGCRG